MKENIKCQIDKITNEIKKIIPAEKIYLFGSYAYGNPTQESDIDLCIVVSENIISKRDILRLIRKSLVDVADFPIDILVYSKEEFTERAEIGSTIEYKIVHEGDCLYEQ
ncbi:nucleotidyltransferase domain-containing protein [Caloramator australicus]|uniref:Nucleotidyltransferase domain protein n=1 Tax=Caloramator australicus RC3 TaxID=857293 RepID=I7KWE6_9CLOT|nr:nucleotidyltransferase domain-containing protein [Caloramator australicus]CCJ34471.1 nucleotidyltransferase domain protein [Caloramator australicus RC3]